MVTTSSPPTLRRKNEPGTQMPEAESYRYFEVSFGVFYYGQGEHYDLASWFEKHGEGIIEVQCVEPEQPKTRIIPKIPAQYEVMDCSQDLWLIFDAGEEFIPTETNIEVEANDGELISVRIELTEVRQVAGRWSGHYQAEAS